MSTNENQIDELRGNMQKVVRFFSVGASETPCGVKISTSFAHVLLTLNALKKDLVNQQILAQELGLNKSSIARTCAGLEEQGFIKIEVHGDDKRNNSIIMTAKGLKMSERLKAQGDQYFASILEKIPKNKTNEILNSIAILAEAIELTSKQGNDE